MNLRKVQLLLLATITTSGAAGQLNCSSGQVSQKLVCEFPFSTGALNSVSALGGTVGATPGVTAAAAVAAGINIAIATQVSQLPLASASGGIVLKYNASIPETFDNLGPILTDRAETVGKHKLFLGFTASQFVFTDIDGLSLKKLPFAFYRAAYNKTGAFVSNTYTKEDINLKFKVNQLIAIATLGISDRVDVTVFVPIEHVSLGTITSPSINYVVNSSNMLVIAPYTGAASYERGTADGLGDVTFNVKTEIWTSEHATVSGVMSVRTPTGDDLNFLGSGAWGFSPYMAYSYLSKVSPHARIGYEWNSITELNNPSLAIGGNLALPGGLQYDVGADWAVKRSITVAADLLGNQYLNTPRLHNTATTLITTNNAPIQFQTSSAENASYSINNVSAGLKWNPMKSLVVTGNVLFQLNNDGLRSRPTPLIGLSYKFGEVQ